MIDEDNEETYEISIKNRFGKRNLTVTVKRKTEKEPEEQAGDNNVKIVCIAEEAIEEVDVSVVITDKMLTEADKLISAESLKVSITLPEPIPETARKIADELNESEIKGICPWTPTQDFSMVCILGKIRKEDIEKTVRPLVIKLIIEHSGGEK